MADPVFRQGLVEIRREWLTVKLPGHRRPVDLLEIRVHGEGVGGNIRDQRTEGRRRRQG